jgi:nitroreductase
VTVAVPIDPSETLPSALPPTDHVARVLLKRGARDDALDLLRAAVRRDPNERACAALLRALEARPDASVYGPDMAIDVGLIDLYARSSMLVEARAVLRGSGLGSMPAGAERLAALDEVLSAAPPDAPPALREAFHQVLDGGAAIALGKLDRIAASGALRPWAARRHALLTRMIFERA